MGAVFVPQPRPNYGKITLPNLPYVLMLLSCKCGFVTWALSRPSLHPPTIYLPFAMIRPRSKRSSFLCSYHSQTGNTARPGPACGYTQPANQSECAVNGLAHLYCDNSNNGHAGGSVRNPANYLCELSLVEDMDLCGVWVFGGGYGGV